ncbi:MAG: serine hydrolase, partial [Ruminococcus sp.]|nr:serine hydrolase [Ruminococcus sp.]
GVYHDKRIVSNEWIGQMTSPKLQLGEMFGNMGYCYLWYRPYKDKPIFAAIGDGGNIIYADPEKRISVGITGTFKPRIFDRVNLIEKNIIPIVERL